MTYNEFKNKAKNYPLFKLEDVFKWFPAAKRQITLNQLNLWCQKGYLENIRRGVYKLADFKLPDPFILANFIYSPSYISLEGALNYYGIIPDIPFAVTSVTVNKTKNFKIKNYGNFFFNHLKPELFFGFRFVFVDRNYSYNIAQPEKALFDYFYFRGKGVDSVRGFLDELRLSLPKDFDCSKIKKWSKLISPTNKTFHKIIKAFISHYD